MAGTRDGSTKPRVLVVEDETLIAMELAMMLSEAGFDVIGPAASIPPALELLRLAAPDIAVLDVNLCGERVTPVAAALLSRRIPFVLASAYGPTELARCAVLADARNIGKPTEGRVLLRALGELLGRQEQLEP